MKRSVICSVLLATLFLMVVGLAAKDQEVKFKTLEVKPFVLAQGVALPDRINSADYLKLFSEQLQMQLEKKGIANQVVGDGASVPEADLGDSIVIEGKMTDFKKAGHTMMNPAVLTWEISVYHLKDHTPITTLTPELKLVPAAFRDDKELAKVTGGWLADQINKALK
jgi:hypothetical protein